MRFWLFIGFCLLLLNTNGQDIHFSQFKNARLNLNPALSGSINSDFEAVFQRRSQWVSITDPFKTISFSLYSKDVYKQFSFGASFINDVAGSSNFATTGINFSISKKIITQSKYTLDIGGLIGALQRSFNFNSLTFYDEEQFINENIFFIDLGFGGVLKNKINNHSNFEFGFSSFHINNPSLSFSNTYTENTPMKHVAYFEYDYFYNNLFFTPLFYYSVQSKESELIYGIDVGNDFNKKEGQINYNGALYIRNNDAIIPQVGIMFQHFSFHISYDINISELSKASNNYGGLEFSIMYSWNAKNKKQKNKFKCPKYL
tara:strand:- start:208 stop:1155 length:948 start_codon:yes stop_codon:yes gene_type:complete